MPLPLLSEGSVTSNRREGMGWNWPFGFVRSTNKTIFEM